MRTTESVHRFGLIGTFHSVTEEHLPVDQTHRTVAVQDTPDFVSCSESTDEPRSSRNHSLTDRRAVEIVTEIARSLPGWGEDEE